MQTQTFSIDSIFQGLNEPQLQAVRALDGPLLILAGAGSGKTKVLTHRVAHLIASQRASVDQILAVTFTNKAAREMEHRISSLLTRLGVILSEPLWVSTFHSFCSRVLRSYGHLLDYKPGFSIYDDGDQLSLIKKIQTQLNISEKIHPPKNFRSRINTAKMEGLGPSEAEKSTKFLFDRETIAVYKSYEEEMKKANALDFGDLLLKVYDLYRMYPEVLKEHQEKFRYIMVDEYQDTNRIQYLLVKALSGGHRNLCVVGDEDQSIYSWRGADISNILGFEKDYPEAVTIKLEQNYRSSQKIVESASRLIRNNTQRKDKTLFTENEMGDNIRLHEAASEYEEAKWVVKSLSEAVHSGEFSWNDVAIFYRTNAQSRVLEEQLRVNSIPYQIIGGIRFFERLEVKDILGYFKILANPADDIAFRRIFNVPGRGLGKTSLENLEDLAFRHKLTLWQASHKAVQEKVFNSGTTNKLKDFLALLESLGNQVAKLDLLTLYQLILDKTNYVLKLRQEDSAEADSRIENLEELSNVIAQFCKERSDANLVNFLEEMALVSDVDAVDEHQPKVTMMTLHVSKGLEFPVVFVVGWEEGLFPSTRGSLEESEDASLEEERRLAYVGMTRARRKLFLSYAITRKVWGQDQFNPPSRFLKEIPQEHLTFTTTATRSRGDGFVSRMTGSGNVLGSGGSGSSSSYRWGESSSLSRSASYGQVKPTGNGNGSAGPLSQTLVSRGKGGETRIAYEDASEYSSQDEHNPFQHGQRVRHPTFGVGSIYQVEGSGADLKVSVLFADQTIKKFVARYARLELI